MSFQITDISRLLPEVLLIVVALMVTVTDIFDPPAETPEAQRERSRLVGSNAALLLFMVFVITLVQSKYLFAVGDQASGGNWFVDAILGLVRNLQNSSTTLAFGVFSTDNLTMVARLVFIGAALLATLLSYDYTPSSNPGEFYGLIVFSAAGMCLMAGASELITAYLALELSSISLYILAGYFRSDKRSAEAGMKYFLFGALSSGILLYGMSLAYGFAANASHGNLQTGGTLTLFSTISGASATVQGANPLLTLSMIFILAGIGYKITVVPFHSWSPDVYQGAPTPITAFISTASKMAGFVLLYRVLALMFPSLVGTPGVGFSGWTSLLALIALATVLVGNLSALPQTNAKRLLAYSSISHAGFLLLALLLWSSAQSFDRSFATSSLLYYLIAYTCTNLGAFGVLSVIVEAVGGDELSDLNGLWRRNIGLAFLMTIFVLSLAGVPPLAGFWAKFFVFMVGYKSGAIWLVVVAVIMTIVSLYYYLRFLKAMWLNEPASLEPVVAPRATSVTLWLSMALVLLLGLFPGVIWNLLGQAALVAGR